MQASETTSCYGDGTARMGQWTLSSVMRSNGHKVCARSCSAVCWEAESVWDLTISPALLFNLFSIKLSRRNIFAISMQLNSNMYYALERELEEYFCSLEQGNQKSSEKLKELLALGNEVWWNDGWSLCLSGRMFILPHLLQLFNNYKIMTSFPSYIH